MSDATWFENFKAIYMGPDKKARHRVLLSGQVQLVEVVAADPKALDEVIAWAKAQAFGVVDPVDFTILERVRSRGGEQAKKARDIKARNRRSEKGRDYSQMTASFKAAGNFERSVAAHPELAAQWSPKNPCRPEEMALSGNGAALFQCPRCGTEWSSTIDNRTKAFRKEGAGLRINCPQCTGRRKTALIGAQDTLSAYLALVENDPGAWEGLPPALRHLILTGAGDYSNTEDSFKNAVLLGNLKGDYTITDVLAVKEVDEISDLVNEAGSDDEVELTIIDLDEAGEHAKAARAQASTKQAVASALAGAGLASAVEHDAILVEHIKRSSIEALWEQIYAHPECEQEILDQVGQEGAKPDSYRRAVAAEFWNEYQAVKALKFPGYEVEQVRDGQAIVMDPALHQKRFAHLVQKHRTMANWSGTGAGKTLAAALAAAATGASEIVVMMPKGVKPQWVKEFKASFPDQYTIRKDLPSLGEDLTSGGKRVWLINYEDLSTDSKAKAARLNQLAEGVDMVIFDEAHQVKATVPGKGSLRNGTVEKFMALARENNEFLAVILQTATPVKTSLGEARSLLRILHGSGHPLATLKDAPTARNASRAYVHLSANAVRHHPEYDQGMTRVLLPVDITSQLEKVAVTIKDLASLHGGTIHPATMAKALFDAKAACAVERVKELRKPVAIYTEFVSGITEELADRFEAEGLRARVLSSDLDADERAQMILDFAHGDFEVFIGSRTMGTGLDGIQKACDHLLVLDMPFTAADDSQLTGRMLRPGQTKDVTVEYLIAEAKAGGLYWSYCKDVRWNRLEFRRGFTDAAVDGVLPDGLLSGGVSDKEHAKSLTGLEGILESLARGIDEPERKVVVNTLDKGGIHR